MSPRRFVTVSPLIGWPSNAFPSAVQSFSVPVSKSRLSGLPSAPTGRTPSFGSAARIAAASRNAVMANPGKESRLGNAEQCIGFSLLSRFGRGRLPRHQPADVAELVQRRRHRVAGLADEQDAAGEHA